MREFSYTITDEIGLHARPAGQLAKQVKAYQSTVEISCGERKAQLKKLMSVMAMAVKCGETVTVRVEGPDEDLAADELEKYFRENV